MMQEQEEKALATTEQHLVPVPHAKVEPLVVTREYVDQQRRSLALLQDMVKDILVEGRDYGRVPGTSQFLWDPGANQIFGGFNVFPGHRRIISHIEDGTKISIIVEVPLIQRQSGVEVGSGIGASSNEESKHKYRWIREEELGLWGYTEDTATSLRTRREEGGGTRYRIPNPDRGELLNVCVKQASKRAEVDAAEALPGVSSTLRELFDPRKSQGKASTKRKEGPTDDDSPKWTKFWGEVRALGLVTESGTPDSARVHQLLGVTSMKEWLASGRSLDEATKVLAEKAKAHPHAFNPIDIQKADVPDGEALEKVMLECFGWAPERVWNEANYTSRGNFEEAGVETAWQLFLRLWEIYKEQHKPLK